MIYAEALYKMNGTLTQTEIDETINRLRDRVGMHRMDLKELQQWNLDLWTEIKRATYRAFVRRYAICRYNALERR